jgi:hypothetical protein
MWYASVNLRREARIARKKSVRWHSGMGSSWKAESSRKEERNMTSLTAFAEAIAMPTTQLTRVIQYEDAASRQLKSHAERKSPRGRGHRQERQAAAPNPMGASRGELTLNLGRNCNFLLTDEAHTGKPYVPA